jgi:hypothetical protein
LLATVKSFCEKHDIDILDMNAYYTRARGRSNRQDEESSTKVEHHFRVDIFTAIIDFQLQELKIDLMSKLWNSSFLVLL